MRHCFISAFQVLLISSSLWAGGPFFNPHIFRNLGSSILEEAKKRENYLDQIIIKKNFHKSWRERIQEIKVLEEQIQQTRYELNPNQEQSQEEMQTELYKLRTNAIEQEAESSDFKPGNLEKPSRIVSLGEKGIWKAPTASEASADQVQSDVVATEVTTETVRLVWDRKSKEWSFFVGKDGRKDLNRLYLSDPVLFELLGNISGKKILDDGCGNGYLARNMCEQGASVIAIDISPEMIAIANEESTKDQLSKIEFHIADGCDLNLIANSSVDHVVSNYVLMDCPNLKAYIESMYRVLKPGGTAIIVILHPCFPIKCRGEESYFTPHQQVVPPFAGCFSDEFLVFHRSLRDYNQAFRTTGFVVDKIEEPHLNTEQQNSLSPELVKVFKNPISIAFLLRKPKPAKTFVSSLGVPQHALGETLIPRKELDEQICQLFTENNHLVILSGPHGVGKTILAYRFAQTWLNQSEHHVRWFTAENEEGLLNDYRQFAQECIPDLDFSRKNRDFVRNKVNEVLSETKHVLLIFDNLEQFKELGFHMSHLPDTVHVLVTTTDSSFLPKDVHLLIDSFNSEEAMRYSSEALSERFSETKEVENFVAAIGSLPVRLGWATGYLALDANRLMTVNDFLQKINSARIEKTIPENFHVFSLIIGNLIEKSLSTWWILQYAAYLDPTFIPIRIFSALRFTNEQIGEAAGVLERCSLARFVTFDGNRGFVLHRLAQEETKIHQSYHYESSRLFDSFNGLLSFFPNLSNNMTTKDLRLYLPHVKKLADTHFDLDRSLDSDLEPTLTQQIIDSLNLRANLSSKISDLYKNKLGELPTSIKYDFRQKILMELSNRLQQALEEKSNICVRNVSVYTHPFCESGLVSKLRNKKKICVRICDQDGHNLYHKYVDNLSAVQMFVPENFRDGIESYQSNDLDSAFAQLKFLINNTNSLRKNFDSNCTTLTFLSQAYLGLGLFSRSDVHKTVDFAKKLLNKAMSEENTNKQTRIQFAEQAVKTFQDSYQQEHLNTAAALNVLSSLCDESQISIDYCLQALEMIKRLTHENSHPLLVDTLSNMGRLYAERMSLEDASRCFTEALEASESVYGHHDHISMVGLLREIGKLCMSRNEFDESIKHFERGLNIVKQTKYEHKQSYATELLKNIFNVGNIFFQLGKFQDSLNTYKMVLRRLNSGCLDSATYVQLLKAVADTYAALNQPRQAFYAYKKHKEGIVYFDGSL